mmetsp:Transcript_35560/g.102164  ORF Transcript_35560/g.102164 Transcript_35560/m.102164 type:complete len:204 (+) Transcript_35560:61-672(+)
MACHSEPTHAQRLIHCHAPIGHTHTHTHAGRERERERVREVCCLSRKNTTVDPPVNKSHVCVWRSVCRLGRQTGRTPVWLHVLTHQSVSHSRSVPREKCYAHPTDPTRTCRRSHTSIGQSGERGKETDRHTRAAVSHRARHPATHTEGLTCMASAQTHLTHHPDRPHSTTCLTHKDTHTHTKQHEVCVVLTDEGDSSMRVLMC